jgi:hypothetical protein
LATWCVVGKESSTPLLIQVPRAESKSAGKRSVIGRLPCRLCELSTKGGNVRQWYCRTCRRVCYDGFGGHLDLRSTACVSRRSAATDRYATLDRQRQCGDAAGKRAARAVFVCQVGGGGLVGLCGGHSGRWEFGVLVVGVRSCQCWLLSSSCVVRRACPPRSLLLPAACLSSLVLSLPPSLPSSTSSARGAV